MEKLPTCNVSSASVIAREVPPGWTFRLANDFFEDAKARLLNRIPRLASPSIGFFQSEVARAHILNGPIFCEHHMPAQDQQDLLIRLVARCTDAVAVIRLNGMWQVTRCTACGCALHDSTCRRCGTPAVPVTENRYRHWVLYCDLKVRHSDGEWTWLSQALHDRRHRVIAWNDDYFGKAWEITPDSHYESPWYIDRWMRPHITVNYPVVRDFLGQPLEPRAVATARQVATRVSERLTLLRVVPVKLKKALKIIDVRAFHMAPKRSCAHGIIR